MDAAPELFAEEVVDAAMAVEEAEAVERFADDEDLEVRLRPGGDVVHAALVLDVEVDRLEAGGELGLDAFVEGHAGTLPSGGAGRTADGGVERMADGGPLRAPSAVACRPR
jgi:hypothetical protein